VQWGIGLARSVGRVLLSVILITAGPHPWGADTTLLTAVPATCRHRHFMPIALECFAHLGGTSVLEVKLFTIRAVRRTPRAIPPKATSPCARGAISGFVRSSEVIYSQAPTNIKLSTPGAMFLVSLPVLDFAVTESKARTS